MLQEQITIEILDCMTQINEIEWNEFCEGRPFTDHRWLCFAEAIEANHEPYYFLLRNGGRLEAAAVCFIQKHFPIPESFPKCIKTIAGYLMRKFPPLYCAIPFSHTSGLLIRSTCPCNLIRPLLEAMKKLAMKKYAPFINMPHLTADNPAWSILRTAGFNRISALPDTSLQIGWSTFSDYQAALPHKKRSEFRRVRNRAQENGVVIEAIQPNPGNELILYHLINNVFKRYHREFPFNRDFLLQALEILGKDCNILVARSNDQIVGCLALMRSGNELLLMWPGLDYNVTWNTFTYHFLMTESVAHAIEMGVHRLRPGTTVYEIKKMMGAILEDRFWALAATYRPIQPLFNLTLKILGKKHLPRQ